MEDVSEKKLTFGMVADGLKLSKVHVRNIFATVLNKSIPDQDSPAEPSDVFCLLVADLLEKVRFLAPEQRAMVLRGVQPLLTVPYAPLMPLIFADERYCIWDGVTGCLDLETGETVDQLPQSPLCTIGYNLPELYRRGVWMLENRNGFHVKKSATGSVDEQGNICGSPADPISGPVRD